MKYVGQEQYCQQMFENQKTASNKLGFVSVFKF